MSLRQIAKQLGVSHTLLVLWRQGKRTLPAHLERRYYQLVTSGYNSKRAATQEAVKRVVGQPGLEPGTSVLSGLRSNRLSYWPVLVDELPNRPAALQRLQINLSGPSLRTSIIVFGIHDLERPVESGRF